MAIYYVNGSNTYNGDGTTAAAAASNGAPGAYNVPPGSPASFGTGTWRLVAGSTLNMGSAALTTGHNAIIEKTGSGANPIILSSNSTILNSSTATGVSITDISIIRSGAVTGVGLEVYGTTNYTATRCYIIGSQTNINANNAVGLQVVDCNFGAASGSYGVRGAATSGTDCSNWLIDGSTFATDIHVALEVSNAANDAGKFTGLRITDNAFNASASSAIIMQSVMNLTDWDNYIEVTGTTTIVRHSGPTAIPAWTAGQTIFLTGFLDIANFGARTVVSVANDTPSAGKQTLTVSGEALVAEVSDRGKGAWLVDSNRAFIAPDISRNTCVGQNESPMLLANFVGGLISYNDISDAVRVGSMAAAIELANCRDGLVVEHNTIDNITLDGEFVDGAGIFTDGGCDGVIVRYNTITNLPGSGEDNSGQGTAFFYAQNCIHEFNTITNCHRGTWMGGAAGSGNIARYNTYTNNRIGVKVNGSPAAGALTLSSNFFTGNDVDVEGIAGGGLLTLGGLTISLNGGALGLGGGSYSRISITPLPEPPTSDSPANFAVRAEIFFAALPTFISEANAMLLAMGFDAGNATTEAAAAASSQALATAAASAAATASGRATAASSATKWVSGTTYAVGAMTWSPATGFIYVRLVGGAGTTDPASDTTNWSLAAVSAPVIVSVDASSRNMLCNEHSILLSPDATTATLPAAPAAGDLCWVTVANGRGDNVVARNGKKIMSIDENLTLNSVTATVRLRYINSTIGWAL